jgi:hypothetical protein
MARTVVAVFESVYMAKQAVWELLDLGFPRERIDLVVDRSMDTTKDTTNDLAKTEKVNSEVVMDELQAGASIGAGIGGSLGITSGLLISLGALRIPPFLASLASGPQSIMLLMLAVAGLSAAAGSLVGSVISGLVGLGIQEEEIRQYAKNVHKGNVTVMIVADWDAVDGTLQVLAHHDPLEVRQRPIEWQKAGPRERKLAERALNVKTTGQDHPR